MNVTLLKCVGSCKRGKNAKSGTTTKSKYIHNNTQNNKSNGSLFAAVILHNLSNECSSIYFLFFSVFAGNLAVFKMVINIPWCIYMVQSPYPVSWTRRNIHIDYTVVAICQAFLSSETSIIELTMLEDQDIF